ncbi:phenylalanine--tRNA ligase subunit beta [Metabacillus sp. GX 13764]|uniref:phenylalanine--tRNA ligase subunit beta n=1 Tax=Metabacillus kandeliae TaxID=2900151 RepID=UPI001E51B8AC|nr:phenylalanine--tRNA ligase subunit beta [Metabacillus kandeliae]MCD7032831.1 phenylalanine--tRNA ligase subunit beta [Metabacillus kandeliae]
MLVSYKWLKEYVDLDGYEADVLAEKITRSGIEVESVEVRNEGITGVVIGHVLEREQHPDADKLNKCLVDIGEEEPVQIICGAPNVEKGQKVAVAKTGAVLPGNFKIKRAKLRGEESNGMICSLQELGMEGKLVPKEYAEGIFVFPSDAVPGEDALRALNLDDQVLELGLTPNRSDCLSMLGVAHEVAAILDRSVRYPELSYHAEAEKASDAVSITIEDKEANPYYAAKIIRNVTIAPSPLWMQTRLMAAGIRPHNNVVDITNFVLLEYGQPLHAFDLDKFGSSEVVIRKAKEGEKIVTLDDQERELKSSHLVITNGSVPQAIAGVMGGADSEVQSDTKNILLESAYFDGQTVRQASKDHGLRSEASARFEKGVDPNRVLPAAERAAQLMALYAGGEVLDGTAEEKHKDWEPAVISISAGKIESVLGMEISAEDVGSIFRRLGFKTDRNEDVFTVTIPTRRGDITIEEDLVEEAARLYGYDNIPSTLPVTESVPGMLTEYQSKRRKVRRYLEGAGLYQAITYSLTGKDKAAKYALNETELTELSLPMSEDRSVLRLSLLPHLIDVLRHNLARQTDQAAVYEIGSVYLSNGKENRPSEREHAAGAITGLWLSQPWQGEKKPADFYVLKGILEGLFDQLGLEEKMIFKQAKREGMHPGRTAEVFLNGELAGFIGQLHPSVQKQNDLTDTYVFELDLTKLMEADSEGVSYSVIPRFPGITRDIALVTSKETAAGDLRSAIIAAGGKLLKEVSVFDVYEGDRLEEGKKSIAFSLKYMDPERTLTDEEVAASYSKIMKAAEEKFGAVLRG